SRRPLTAANKDAWARVAAHIGIGFRLRRKLAELAPDANPREEAVLAHDGRCVHAEGDARSAESRELLRDAARAVMHARSRLRRGGPGHAREIWRGRRSGQWSLVDRFDADGKAFLVAHRNAPDVRDSRALTRRESEVAGYLALGLSNKLIG